MGKTEVPEWACTPPRERQGQFYLHVEKGVNVCIDKKKAYLLGRNANTCDIVLDHKSVSRKHAYLVHARDGEIYVVDLSSAQGMSFEPSFVLSRYIQCIPVHLQWSFRGDV